MSKYDPLCKWLQANSAPRISATFKQIEEILGFGLPNTSRRDSAWWANERSAASRHVQCKAWLDAGFHTENLSITGKTVDFVSCMSKG